MQATRRQLYLGTAAIALLGAGGVAYMLRPETEIERIKRLRRELMQPGALPDMALGQADAPVTIVEYASMTCAHCARFNETTFPELKTRYVDTGKVRYILREFPLDDVSLAAFMLARTAAHGDAGKYFGAVDMLFRQQRLWAVETPLQPLRTLMSQAGMGEDEFKACLADDALQKNVMTVLQRAVEVFKVEATPTFFVNGKSAVGALSIEEMAKMVESGSRS